MKKIISLLLIAIVAITLFAGCSRADDYLLVGATDVPHAEILEYVKEDLAAEGITLKVKVFTKYELLNPALKNRRLDANFFQHQPFLDYYLKKKPKANLVSAGGVHVEPMYIYRGNASVATFEDIPQNGKVFIPSDATNCGRALLLLQAKGLITLKENAGVECTKADIVTNTKNITFTELSAELIPSKLSESDASVINTNYALAKGLNPLTDTIGCEGADSPYVNIIAIKAGDEEKEKIKKLIAALQTQKVKDFILEKYEGTVVPAF